MSVDYRKIMNVLAKGNKCQFDIPKSDQLTFLVSHPNPKNDIDRSFYQYKAQMLFVSLTKRLVFNLISLIVIFPFIIIAFIKRISCKYRYKADAIIERNTHSGVIPTVLYEKYQISSKEWNIGWSLGFNDLSFLFRLSSYVLRSPYFVFKIAYKAAIYSSMFKAFRPNAVIVFNEYSFTSSALTYYCESHDVKHIDVMHGEKIFHIRDSYFRFSETYVWATFYIELFVKMKAPREQFIAALPPFMTIEAERYSNPSMHSDYTYYLAQYNEEEIANVVSSMDFAKANGQIVKYRPHPRYSDISLLKKYVSESDIEYPKETDIMVSVANTDCAVGVFTTVLNQAYHAGKKVLIDDINFPKGYEKLSELEYSLLDKPVEFLSTYQK